MQVLVAMSGGVDSSVAAARLVEAGHEVVGVTMKLWGGSSDTGCCSVSDVDDARRVAQQLGIDHAVFNFTDDFDTHVVAPFVAAHQRGETPNPCVECNRHLKFDRLLRRADQLGFDAVATGHHCRVVATPAGPRVGRGADLSKDQSYVVHMLTAGALDRVMFPIGGFTKDQVRVEAARLGLRTAAKPDSQDVCFITSSGRQAFLAERTDLHPGVVVDRAGTPVGEVAAVELVTIGQRRGLGGAHAEARYAINVDVPRRTITIGSLADLHVEVTELADVVWIGEAVDRITAQTSAHGHAEAATVNGAAVVWDRPHRRVAPGQSVVLYDGDLVVGWGLAV